MKPLSNFMKKRIKIQKNLKARFPSTGHSASLKIMCKRRENCKQHPWDHCKKKKNDKNSN